MNARLFTLAFALLLVAASNQSSSAQAQAENVPERELDAGAPAHTSAAEAKTDADRLAQLQSIEAARRVERAEALKDPQAWALNRPQRAAQHRREIAGFWGDFVGSVDAHAELRMHADRMARLNRMLDLAEHKADSVLTSRIHADVTRELSRHVNAMGKVRALSGMQ